MCSVPLQQEITFTTRTLKVLCDRVYLLTTHQIVGTACVNSICSQEGSHLEGWFLLVSRRPQVVAIGLVL